jgi:hypothetical protein
VVPPHAITRPSWGRTQWFRRTPSRGRHREDELTEAVLWKMATQLDVEALLDLASGEKGDDD